MNYGLAVLTFLFLAGLGTTVMAASSANVSVKNNINTNSSSNSKVTNHIEVEVNGEKKVIDDTQEGTNINSNIKVEAKSENGQTTINVSGNPDSVKEGSTTEDEGKTDSQEANSENKKQAETAATQEDEIETVEPNLFERITIFFKGMVSIFNIFS